MSQQLPERRPISVASVDKLPSGFIPARTTLIGNRVQLEPLNPQLHAEDLFTLSHDDDRAANLWDYLPYGPFADVVEFSKWMRGNAALADPIFYAVQDKASGKAGGVVSYLNISPLHGSIEIGHIWFTPMLQNTAQSTEALFLLMTHALDDLSYRRLEWKCDAMNEPSRSAAARLGFSFEGIFYNHLIVKGRNRDTAWFSIIDTEWPRIRANFEIWLAPENFDKNGQQLQSLRVLNQF